ncbi:hypothetical protein [Agromyces kandeliae]|uniref:Uncharacterized protein n=1 Tax=Agromyces kandeliae TaxID=2666141 RepID=A0A6L5R5G2_9MICO|nr:hypothetical protein [Agromyces kandeliae]MRX45326.1 hypothetical protein [Agromyces kandeliae]
MNPDEMFDPEHPENNPANIVTMAELVKATGLRQPYRFTAILDAFTRGGGQATHLIWTLALELAAALAREVGPGWAQVVETTSTMKQAEVAAWVAVGQEEPATEVQHDSSRAHADVSALRRLVPPPRTVRDVKSRMGWGSGRASAALRAYRVRRDQG